MTKRLPLLIILVFPILICFFAWYCWYAPVATVILVRHAERLNDTDTTSISESGIERAKALENVVREVGIQRIYVSEKIRTVQTAAPATTRRGIIATRITASDISRYVDSVKSHRGDGILIVGHSDTLPQIIRKLGISDVPTIPLNQFDDLFVVTMFRFRSTLVHLKYGAPSN